MSARSARTISIFLGVVAVLSGAGLASAEKPPVVCVGNLQVGEEGHCEGPAVTGACFAGEMPKSLPRKTSRRVNAFFSCKFDYSDLSSDPRVTEEVVALDRNVSLDVTGLPACGRQAVEDLGTRAARHRCLDALVGEGTAYVVIPSLSSSPIPLRLMLFNAGTRNGTTRMLVHAAPTKGPLRETLVAPMRIANIHEGRYGLRAVTRFPPIAGGEGALVDFELTIGGGGPDSATPPSVGFARCPDEHFKGTMETVVSDGTRLMSTPIRPCTPVPAPRTR